MRAILFGLLLLLIPAGTTSPAGAAGPALALNGFVLKETEQCRQEDAGARRACCERLLHPNACR